MNTTTATTAKITSLPWLAAWACASAIGITVGTALPLQVMWSLGESTPTALSPVLVPVLGGTVFGLGIGFCIGLAQWLILRASGTTTSLRWLGGTLLGSVPGAIVTIAISNTFSQWGETVWVNLVAFLLLGAILGAGQLLVSRDVVSHPAWILASAMGVLGSSAMLLGLGDVIIPAVIVGGLAYGIITAAALWWFANK
jgi:hypothetical protein